MFDLFTDYNYFQCDPDDDQTAAGIKQAENEAESAALDNTVNIYIDDTDGEVLTLCAKCRNTAFGDQNLRYIDRAAHDDICFECEANDYE